ncbi:unnamed protein product [Allacma fusca]|uniref:Uncharacterized protein n=1 Tax=Allacma fusca TaxID=39272 RepID=A0A8J2J2E8_9HEXA|nr:unnamed protein product [Allacma fusca]
MVKNQCSNPFEKDKHKRVQGRNVLTSLQLANLKLHYPNSDVTTTSKLCVACWYKASTLPPNQTALQIHVQPDIPHVPNVFPEIPETVAAGFCSECPKLAVIDDMVAHWEEDVIEFYQWESSDRTTIIHHSERLSDFVDWLKEYVPKIASHDSIAVKQANYVANLKQKISEDGYTAYCHVDFAMNYALRIPGLGSIHPLEPNAGHNSPVCFVLSKQGYSLKPDVFNRNIDDIYNFSKIRWTALLKLEVFLDRKDEIECVKAELNARWKTVRKLSGIQQIHSVIPFNKDLEIRRYSEATTFEIYKPYEIEQTVGADDVVIPVGSYVAMLVLNTFQIGVVDNAPHGSD